MRLHVIFGFEDTPDGKKIKYQVCLEYECAVVWSSDSCLLTLYAAYSLALLTQCDKRRIQFHRQC